MSCITLVNRRSYPISSGARVSTPAGKKRVLCLRGCHCSSSDRPFVRATASSCSPLATCSGVKRALPDDLLLAPAQEMLRARVPGYDPTLVIDLKYRQSQTLSTTIRTCAFADLRFQSRSVDFSRRWPIARPMSSGSTSSSFSVTLYSGALLEVP
jgi:hypothetical protein